MKKRVLYISTRFPYPASGGREKMIISSLEMLYEKFDIYFVYFGKQADSTLEASSGITNICRLPTSNALVMLWNLMRYPSKSIQECLFYSSSSQRKLNGIIENFDPHIVVADMIRTAQYVENCGIKKILEMDDLLSLRYERAVHQGIHGNLLGTFAALLPSIVARLASGRFLRNIVLRHEAKKIENRERELAIKFDAVTLVSASEVASLKSKLPEVLIEAIPPTVNRITNLKLREGKKKKLLFLGNLKTNQNLASIDYIIRKVLPLLEESELDYEFDIVGGYDEKAEKIACLNRKVRLIGFVNSLQDVFADSTMLLSPIAFGSGIKIKIIDALSYGIPVVTNSIGIEGIPAISNHNLIVADDPLAVRDAVLRIANDQKFANTLSINGRALVEKEYLRKTVEKKYLFLINSIISDH